jgi:hypothetical protein
LLHGGQEGDRETEREREKAQDTLLRPAPRDSLPPTRPHLLKFPLPPKIGPPVGDQVSVHESMGTLHIQTITLTLNKICYKPVYTEVVTLLLSFPHSSNPLRNKHRHQIRIET